MTISQCKRDFPALRSPWLFLDGPGGAQLPQSVIDAMSQRYQAGVANFHGDFDLSRDMDHLNHACRTACAHFLGAASPDSIHFGPNMTTLSFQLAAHLSKNWKTGDNIILSKLDHHANVSPFLQHAQNKGVEVRWLEVQDETDLCPEQAKALLDSNTKLLSMTGAANATGTLPPIHEFSKCASSQGVFFHVDAVHLAVHHPIDVQALEVDALTCSAYKFYGPHLGIQYIKPSWRDKIEPFKVSCSPNDRAHKFETGTQNPAAMVGVMATFEYLNALCDGSLHQSMSMIQESESQLSAHFLDSLQHLKSWRCIGRPTATGRTPTFALLHREKTPEQCSKHLAEQQISSWHGHFYAQNLMEDLGLKHGVLRLGFSIYHDDKDVDRTIKALAAI